MPIYEFRCVPCGAEFERIILPGREDTSGSACPSCGGQQIERKISAFAVSSDGTRSSNLAEGRKRAQKDLTEKRDADYKSYVDHVSEH